MQLEMILVCQPIFQLNKQAKKYTPPLFRRFNQLHRLACCADGGSACSFEYSIGKRASRAASETMLERSDDYPQGGLKSHKKWGGVLLKAYLFILQLHSML